ncbi:MAG: tripartite tricarboxylate transporter TctB family protein [SAR324 cluster bacterium]|nr:tripartite tricarboxylate transporter TctB family protein [SAR324 cluster bacterium]|tara:strand:- start:83 stop:559 length:477 start_codon:yes stop_codon:yes gene_type:complete
MSHSKGQTPRFTGNILLPLSILLMCSVFYMQTLDFPQVEDVGPEVVPYLWMIFLVVFCVFLLFQAVKKRGQPDPESGQLRTLFIYVAFIILYLMLIEIAGYFVSTFIYLIVSMLYLGFRNRLSMVAISLGWLVISYGIFYKLLYIPLPIGPFLSPWVE